MPLPEVEEIHRRKKIGICFIFTMETEKVFDDSIFPGSNVYKNMKWIDFLLDMLLRYDLKIIFT